MVVYLHFELWYHERAKTWSKSIGHHFTNKLKFKSTHELFLLLLFINRLIASKFSLIELRINFMFYELEMFVLMAINFFAFQCQMWCAPWLKCEREKHKFKRFVWFANFHWIVKELYLSSGGVNFVHRRIVWWRS